MRKSLVSLLLAGVVAPLVLSFVPTQSASAGPLCRMGGQGCKNPNCLPDSCVCECAVT